MPSIRLKSIALIFLLLLAACAPPKHLDIERIGRRDVGQGFNFYSWKEEIKLGQQLAAQVRQQAEMVRDPAIVDYVRRVGRHVARHSDAEIPFHFEVIENDEVNAFALPGGYVFVYTGLLREAENEAELAGVIAHEISHVTARHATRMISRMQLLNLASIPLIFLGGQIGAIIQQSVGFGLTLTMLGVTRGSEKEADILGVQYLWNAGYDPHAYLTFLGRLLEKKGDQSRVAAFFSTHPTYENRIELIREQLRILPPRPDPLVQTREFERIKARVKRIADSHRGE